MKAHFLKGLFLVAALGLAACGNNDDSSNTGGFSTRADQNGQVDAATATPAVEISATGNITFSPKTVTINAGDVVRWTNTAGSTVHTVTADPALVADANNVSLPAGAPTFHSGNLNPGQTYAYRFAIPGTYKYVCIPHEDDNMMGTIIVKAPGEDCPNADCQPDRDRDRSHDGNGG